MTRTIDIRRTADATPITKIRFADDSSDHYIANVLSTSGNAMTINDSETSRQLRILDVAHARDLIKALEKAIELGMVK